MLVKKVKHLNWGTNYVSSLLHWGHSEHGGEEAGVGVEHKIEKSRTIRKIGIEFNHIS
jgi:hypothetical protein